MERLRGRIMGHPGDVMIHIAKLWIDGASPIEHESLSALVIECEDGRRLQLVPGSAPTIRCELEKRRASWSDVETLEAVRPFLDRAPGPHVTVELHSIIVHGGDEIEVLGEVCEAAFESTVAGYREPAARRLEVRPEVIAVGPTRVAEMDDVIAKRTPQVPTARLVDLSRPPWGPIALWAALAIVFLARAVTDPTFAVGFFVTGNYELVGFPHATVRFPTADLAQLESRAIALVCLSTMFMIANTRRPLFTTSADFGRLPPMVVGLGPLVVIVVVMFVWATLGTIFVPRALIVVGATAVSVIVVAIVMMIIARRFGRSCNALLAAPVGLRTGAWSAGIGTIRDASESSITIATDPPVRVEIANAHRASSIERLTTSEVMINADAGSDSPRVPTKVIAWTPQFTPGNEVLVAGRPRLADRSLELSSGGPESLLVFATRPGDDPRSRLRSFLWRTRLLAAASLTCAIASIVVFGRATSLIWSLYR